MIPYQVDPSLHAARPTPEQLDDGFAPPASQQRADEPLSLPPEHVGLDGEKSLF